MKTFVRLQEEIWTSEVKTSPRSWEGLGSNPGPAIILEFNIIGILDFSGRALSVNSCLVCRNFFWDC